MSGCCHGCKELCTRVGAEHVVARDDMHLAHSRSI